MAALIAGLFITASLIWVVRAGRRRGARVAADTTAHDMPSRLLARAVSRLPADRAPWGKAMFGELQQLESQPQRWRFAVGCATAALFLPSRAESAGLAAKLVAATALTCAGLVAYGLIRYPGVLTHGGTWPVLVTFLAVLAGYTVIAGALVRRGPVARSGLASGIGLAAVWIITGIAAVSHPSHPAYSLVLLFIPMGSLAVGVAAAARSHTAVVRQQVVLLSAIVAGLVVFLVLATDTLLTAGGPYDAGQIRDFPTSGLPNLATYAVSDNLGTAMMLLLLVPALTTACGCAGAGVIARLHRVRPPG